LKEISNDVIYQNGLVKTLSKLTKYNYTNILSFNYTLLDIAKTEIPNIKYVENIHGSINDKYIIIGIDSSNIKYDDYQYIFTKTYRKVELFVNNSSNQGSVNKYLDKEINKIVFYGHSLNEHDHAYFQTIFDFYDLYNSSLTLVFKYSIFDLNQEEEIKDNL